MKVCSNVEKPKKASKAVADLLIKFATRPINTPTSANATPHQEAVCSGGALRSPAL